MLGFFVVFGFSVLAVLGVQAMDIEHTKAQPTPKQETNSDCDCEFQNCCA